MIKEIEALYSVSTPMYIDSTREGKKSVRGSSIKGALRFWWRALNWSRIRAECPDDKAALKALHHQECGIFGAAADASDEHKGQSKILLRVKDIPLEAGAKQAATNKASPKYLMGQGSLLAPIDAGHQFKLTCCFKINKNEGHHPDLFDQMEDVLLAFGIFGGLGARNRKGFGSTSIISLKGGVKNAPHDVDQLKMEIKRLLMQSGGTMPPLSAFSEETLVNVIVGSTSAGGYLSTYSDRMAKYRLTGKGDNNFVDDTNIIVDVSNNIDKPTFRPDKLPKRAVFGLPLPFSNIKKTELGRKEGVNSIGRRASPLFSHIHTFADGKHCQVLLVIKAAFLPDGDEYLFKSNGKSKVVSANPEVDWDTLFKFVHSFKNGEIVTHG